MSRIQRIVALAAVGLFGAVGVTGVMAGAGGVFGGSSDGSPAAAVAGDFQTPDSLVAESGDTPDGATEVVGDVIDCPTGEDTQFKFEQNGSEFEVTGTLVSLTATEVQVTGPDGVPGGNPVIAAVAANAEVKGDPQTGDAVKVEGTVLGDGTFVAREIKPACEPAADVSGDQGDDSSQGDTSSEGDVIPCPSGENTHFKFEQSGSEFEATGILGDGGTAVMVTLPTGDVTVVVDPSAEIKGDPQPGDPVKVEGAVLEDGSLVAREVESACDDDADDGDVEDADDGDVEDVDDGDDSSSSGDEQSGDDQSSDSNHDSSNDDSSHDSSGPSGDHGEED